MSKVDVRNIRLFIAYDGTNYLGWQVQPKGPTIQGKIQEVLSRVLGHKVKLKAAGRTDTGVHALHQVAHFLTTSDKSVEVIFRALSGLLPKDIVVWRVEEVYFKFHAQKHALKKTYRYFIHNSITPNPLTRLYTWWLKEELNLEEMQRCLPFIIGEKDFASFKKSGTDIKSTIRTIYDAKFFWCTDDVLCFEIVGRGFMRYMVRNLVGAFVEVGRGKMTAEDFKALMDARDRSLAPPAAPPQGLVLYRIEYPEVEVFARYPENSRAPEFCPSLVKK